MYIILIELTEFLVSYTKFTNCTDIYRASFTCRDYSKRFIDIN